MVERKLFKTKLCLLYQKGRCSRQNCSFAHGNSELRRISSPIHGRRGYGDNDLRDKLDRRHSPRQTYSPDRDARDSSRSLDKERDRKLKKRQRLDGQSDVSGSLRISDGVDDQGKEGRFTSDSRSVLMEELKQVQDEVNRLDNQKSQLGVKVEERVQEVDSLTSKIQELEAQLHKEKEENRRILSKINKFVKAHDHRLQMQDRLKRSETRLHKLADELGSDINKIGANEEDSSINIVSDGDAACFLANPQSEQRNNVFPSNKKLDGNRGPTEHCADLEKLHMDVPARVKRASRWNIPAPSNYDKESQAVATENGRPGPLSKEEKHEKKFIVNLDSSDKQQKTLESGFLLPSTTSMATNAVDEDIDIELEDNVKAVGTAATRDNYTYEINGLPLPLPPPPLIPKNSYSQYEGDDENIDVDVAEEMEQVDNV